MNILTISDTHGKHEFLDIPKDIDMIIHAGDFSNYFDPRLNLRESVLFLQWFESLKIKHKVLIAGNHDTAVEKKLVDPRVYGITYLEHESCEIAGLTIFGSPYTPTFNNWAFNRARHKLHNYWEDIPENTNILVTHGPPKGILDITEDIDRTFKQCGCSALFKKVQKVEPILHIFGHLHTEEGIYNSGQFSPPDLGTVFVNASVTNLKLKLINNGQIFWV